MRGRLRSRARRALAGCALALLLAPEGAHPVPASPPAAPDSAAPRVAILCYHDLSRDSTAPLQTVSPEFLRDQIRACKADGWTFLSLSELLARRDHPERLPRRTMVLTFDDGYRSFAELALPVLRAEGVPATLAVVGAFVTDPPEGLPPVLGWEELRALDAADDVEVVSHSHGLHRYETSNPFLDTAPSLATRRYRTAEHRYEDREEYRARIGADLAEAQAELTRALGRPATVMVWPYGAHNEMARALAARHGFTTGLTLEWRAATPVDLERGLLPRIMVTRHFDFRDPARRWLAPPPLPIRALEVDLDALWDPDDSVFRDRLDQMVARARALGATHVVLPACPDPRGDGRLLRAYAMNHQVPVLADVWSMAASKFIAARLRVWLRAPALNLTWVWERHPEWRLQGAPRDARVTAWGTRLSPDLDAARRAAADWFTDLAVYLPIDGVVFDDDATVLAGERLALDGNASTAARVAALRGVLDEARRAVRAWRPDCRFARVLRAATVERAGPRPEWSQDLDECLGHDELVVVDDPARLASPGAVARVARAARTRWSASSRAASSALPPVLLMLPGRDPLTHAPLGARRLQALADAARHAGAVHLGVGPVAANGEVAIGLLDDAGAAPGVRPAERRR